MKKERVCLDCGKPLDPSAKFYITRCSKCYGAKKLIDSIPKKVKCPKCNHEFVPPNPLSKYLDKITTPQTATVPKVNIILK